MQVKDFFLQTKEHLKLHSVTRDSGFTREIIPLAWQKGIFPILLWGKKDLGSWKVLTSDKREQDLDQKLSGDVACVILADGLSVPGRLKKRAQEKGLALFTSEISKRSCQKGIERFFSRAENDQVLVPGGLLRMFGLGVLIVGDSGIGKSESALELISRGHRFVSDDVTFFVKGENNRLIGSAPDFSRNFMEIRGLGIINIKEIFGSASLSKQTNVDLVIQLKRWEEGKEYDRLGLEFPDEYEILGKKVSQIIIPVAPGRNISTLIEVACKVYLCRQKGYHAPHVLLNKLDRALSRKLDPGKKNEGP